jgi:hypothetical protein
MKHPAEVIIRPLLTEKGTQLRLKYNQYLFEVAGDATKIDIASRGQGTLRRGGAESAHDVGPTKTPTNRLATRWLHSPLEKSHRHGQTRTDHRGLRGLSPTCPICLNQAR